LTGYVQNKNELESTRQAEGIAVSF